MTTTLPLTGLKVLDFCWVAVGPMTTKYLAEYNATVLRVESGKRPETLRRDAIRMTTSDPIHRTPEKSLDAAD